MLPVKSKLIAHIMLCLFTLNAATTATSSLSSFDDTTESDSEHAVNGQNLNQNIVLMLTSHRNSSSNNDSSHREQSHQRHENSSLMENSNEDLNLNKFNLVATTPRIIIPSTKPPNR